MPQTFSAGVGIQSLHPVARMQASMEIPIIIMMIAKLTLNGVRAIGCNYYESSFGYIAQLKLLQTIYHPWQCKYTYCSRDPRHNARLALRQHTIIKVVSVVTMNASLGKPHQ